MFTLLFAFCNGLDGTSIHSPTLKERIALNDRIPRYGVVIYT